MMRITGGGSDGHGQGAFGRDRADQFRARHGIGERLRGRVLRRDPSGLFWVQVGGEELLAQLEVQAEPGDQLVFVVEALLPEIRLRALASGGETGLSTLVQRFRAAREAFEATAWPLLRTLAGVPPLPSRRREALAIALSGHAEADTLYAETQDALFRLNAALGPEAGARGLYEPWLLPGLRSQELLRRTSASGLDEGLLSGRDPTCGAMLARLLWRPPQCSLRLSAERPDSSAALQAELAALVREGLGVEPELLGVVRLSPRATGGVLGELLGDAPPWASGGLNTRV